MADSVTTGNTITFATDLNATEVAHWPISKVAWGTRDSAYNVVDLTHGLPVQSPNLELAQGSTTSAQIGALIQGAATTAAPTYTTATTNPLSVTTRGELRVILSNAGTVMALTPADGAASATSMPSAAYNIVWNGTTWDRAKSANGASATTGTGLMGVAGLLFDGTNFQLPRGAASLGDAVNNVGMIPANGFVYNSASWDRARGMIGDSQAATGLTATGHMLLNGSGTYDRMRTVTGNTGAATTGVAMVSNYEGFLSSLNLTATTAVKATAGRLFKVSVVVAGSLTGTINDCATTGAAAAANQIGTIPNTVGVYEFNWPMLTGLVIVPGTGQTVAVVYQ